MPEKGLTRPCLDREKKQNEQLASQLLGKDRKNRRVSAPGSGAVQKGQAPKSGSLASRIGVPKVSSRIPLIFRKLWTVANNRSIPSALHHFPPDPPPPSQCMLARRDRIPRPCPSPRASPKSRSIQSKSGAPIPSAWPPLSSQAIARLTSGSPVLACPSRAPLVLLWWRGATLRRGRLRLTSNRPWSLCRAQCLAAA